MGLKEKQVNVAGSGYEGFMLFLAEILCCAGRKILLADHTEEHKMMEYFPHVEGIDPADNIIDNGGIGYVILTGINKGKMTADIKENTDSYDIQFNLFDLKNFSSKDILKSDDDKKTDLSLFITDEKAENIAALSHTTPGSDSILIINDFTGAIKRRIENTAGELGIEKVYVLPFNLRDRKLEILAGYNDRFKFSGLSREREEVLTVLTGLIVPELTEKEKRKAYKTAAGGGRK